MGNSRVTVMYSEDDFVPISGLQHLLFCERRAALVFIENQWKDNVFTIEGTIDHERVDSGIFETRGDIRYSTGLRICSFNLGIIGRADMVEFLRDDEYEYGVELDELEGKWKVRPVEYKRGVTREEIEYEVQLCAQTLCFEEMLKTKITSGYIYYANSNRRHEVVFDEDLRNRTELAILRLHELISQKIVPKAQYEKKCRACSMYDICMPKISNRSVNEYIKSCLR